MNKFFRFYILLLVLLSDNVYAQDGLNDSSFNPSSFSFNTGADDYIRTVSLRKDGKIVVGGNFIYFNNHVVDKLGILNSDGSLQNDVGLVSPGIVYCSAIQSDDKYLFGGSNFLKRLNSDESVDLSFNPTVNGAVKACALQSDGKILIGGSFTSVNNTPINRIARLNSDGTLDLTFDPGAGANNQVEVIAIQKDGKIFIGGSFSSYNNFSKSRILRLNSDGSIDNMFSIASGTSKTVYSIIIQSDGKILVGGEFLSIGNSLSNNLARFNPDGSYDNSFYTGSGPNGAVYDILIRFDGKILLCGLFTTYNGFSALGLACLNSNGWQDQDYYLCANGPVMDMAIQNDGKIIVCGKFTTCKNGAINNIVRLNEDSSLDPDFNVGTGANENILVTEVQKDGKIIIAGEFTVYNGEKVEYFTRINPDGSRDATFYSGLGVNDVVYAIAIQSDNKILVGGRFNEYNGVPQNRLMRLNSDGTIDPTFDIGSGFDDEVTMLTILSNGKILVGGLFTNFNGLSCGHSLRLNADGSVDAGFDAATFLDELGQVAIQQDGKIISGGRPPELFFNNLCRLNQNGSIDASFQVGTGCNGYIRKIVVQPDRKIVVVGHFTLYNGVNRNGIVRLNENGSLDESFDPGTGFNDYYVGWISLQTDGKMLVSGAFTSYNGNKAHYLVRINPDGSIDDTFHHGRHVDNVVHTTALQSDGKIIIAGQFSSYDEAGRNRIARLNNSLSPVSANISSSFNLSNKVIVYPNPTKDIIYVDIESLFSNYTRLIFVNSSGIVVDNRELGNYSGRLSEAIDISHLSHGIYFLEFITEQGKEIKKIAIY